MYLVIKSQILNEFVKLFSLSDALKNRPLLFYYSTNATVWTQKARRNEVPFTSDVTQRVTGRYPNISPATSTLSFTEWRHIPGDDQKYWLVTCDEREHISWQSELCYYSAYWFGNNIIQTCYMQVYYIVWTLYCTVCWHSTWMVIFWLSFGRWRHTFARNAKAASDIFDFRPVTG